MNSTNSTVAVLAAMVAEQATTNAQQNAINAQQAATIACTIASLAEMLTSLQDTMATMQARVTVLEPTPSAAPSLSPSAMPTVSPSTAAPTPQPTAAPAVCDGTIDVLVVVDSDAALAQLAPEVTRACSIADLIVGGSVSDTMLLAEAFQGLQIVTAHLTIQSTSLTALDGGFGALTSVGGDLQIQLNPTLTTLDGSFAALTSVGGQLQISQNNDLTTIGASFGSLQSIGELYWFANAHSPQPSNVQTAGSRSFCASAVAVLCPTTTSCHNSGWQDDSDNCCNAYCATTTDC